MDWLHFSRDVRDIMTKFWATVDTILMGRKTWEVASRSGAGSGGTGGMRTYVFSRTLKALREPGVQLVSAEVGEFVRNLKNQEGKGICLLGGGDFARSLFEAGAIDEVGLNVHPIVLGSGIPFFLDAGRRIHLELTECREIDGGCVFLNYRVKR